MACVLCILLYILVKAKCSNQGVTAPLRVQTAKHAVHGSNYCSGVSGTHLWAWGRIHQLS
jgi:hypothetical protein